MPTHSNPPSDQHPTTDLNVSGLSHLNSNGDINMVDVSGKTATTRVAHAAGQVCFPTDIYAQIKAADGMTKKGSITQTAHIAGIMAAKRTHDLIPLCHPLPLDKIGLTFAYDDRANAITVAATVKVTHKTGVEMEALMAASTAALTIYDMCKAVDKGMVMGGVRVLEKKGGKSFTPAAI